MVGTIAPEYLSPPANRTAAAGIATAAADAFLGVFVSCTYMSAQTKLLTDSNYWPGGTIVMPGTPITAYVNDDPMAIFSIQISSSVANAAGIRFLNTSSGLNANLGVAGINFTDPILALTQNPSTGNTRNGISAYVALTQTPITGTNLRLNGSYTNSVTGIVNLGFSSVLSTTSAGADLSAVTFNVTGSQNGVNVTDAIKGGAANATVTGVQYFNVITSINVAGVVPGGGTVSIGTAGTAGFLPLIILNTEKGLSDLGYAL